MNIEDPDHAHRVLLRRVNNFRTVCMTHAEAALDSQDPDEMAEALRWILEGARTMEPSDRPREHVSRPLEVR